MKQRTLRILHADDDIDTCSFFEVATQQFSAPTSLTSVHDGSQLMEFLGADKTVMPDVLFLDINMPRKNGYECLAEIKSSMAFQNIPVIIFSTSLDSAAMDYLYNRGAQFFIKKPADFSQFKKVIQHILSFISEGKLSRPGRDKFVFTSDTPAISVKKPE